MNIVIVGAGKVGEALCRDLAHEKHDITLIEGSEDRLEQMIRIADITGIVGNGALYDIQSEAGVADCDIYIAVTPNDETNIIAAITARHLGARHSIARVRSPEYSLQMNFLRESLGISLMINPEYEAAREIARLLRFPAALHVNHFEHGRLNLVEYLLPPDAPFVGMKLRDLPREYTRLLIGALIREGRPAIPNGNTTLLAGDHLYLAGDDDLIAAFCQAAERRSVSIRRVLIVGGGRLTRYILDRLNHRHYQTKVIEVKPALADALAADYPEVEVICGDGTDQAFLREERMADYHTVIAATGVDEENMIVAISAARMGVPKTITKVNRTDLLKVLDNVGLQAIITPNRIVADQIIRYVRSLENSEGSAVVAYARLGDGALEAVQFHVSDSCKACHRPLSELAIRPGILLLAIQRGEQRITPGGGDRILPGDDVVVITGGLPLRDLDEILA
ncbi:MAG: Trk system potassium transporter TrkA [Bacillota bacterium]|nr:Trk system potassium transporter TrkA [Bacillota bacterium]